MDFEELIAGVGEKIGIGPSLMNGEDSVTLSDGEITFVISTDESRTAVDLFGEIGPLPEQGVECLLKMLLRANFRVAQMGGAALALAESEDTVILKRRLALSELAIEGFVSLLQEFVNAIGEWKSLLADYERIGPAVDDAKREEWKQTFPDGQFIKP